MSDALMFLTDVDLAERIRAHRNAGLKLNPAAAAMLADAIDIADHTARSDIECFFLRNEDGWYNLSAGMPYDWLPQILRYLTARGLIERKTGDKLDADLDADLVRFVKRA